VRRGEDICRETIANGGGHPIYRLSTAGLMLVFFRAVCQDMEVKSGLGTEVADGSELGLYYG